ARYDQEWPSIYDPSGRIASSIGAPDAPTTLFLDRRHRVVAVIRGTGTLAGFNAAFARAKRAAYRPAQYLLPADLRFPSAPRALAQSVDGAGSTRIQCTPDLQPTDVTGLAIFNQKTRDFEFRPGPIFANVVLVDEINRAMPKTQSALLEAMAEAQVTVDGVTRRLDHPFLLLATDNPIEHEG